MHTQALKEGLANGLSATRIVAGPVIAKHLYETPPEERTWKDAGLVAFMCATDKADGWLASTEFGGWLDQIADKAFIIPQFGALSINQEIPAIHTEIKMARDALVTGIRYWAARDGKDVSAGELGKQKTMAEMLTVVAANSPLATNEEILRAGASMSSALSITSGANYFLDYTRSTDEKPMTTDDPRNGGTRRAFASPVSALAQLIDEKAPRVTPDHITLFGEFLVSSSLVLAIVKPDHPAVATSIYTTGSLMDGVDGTLARLKGMSNGGTTIEGMLKDVRADKRQEMETLLALSVIARRRGNNVAANNYAVGAMTSCLPALYRAKAESAGLVVPEDGTGSRVIKATLAGAGIALNKNQDASDILSAMIVTGNINTAKQRRHVVRRGAQSPYCKGVNSDAKFMKHAEIRHNALLPMTAAGMLLGAAALKYQPDIEQD